MRFHVTDATRRWLNVLSVLLIVSWLLTIAFTWIGPAGLGYSTGWALLGAGVALGFVARHARGPDGACSFCDQPRASVQYLLAGPAVSICERCTQTSMAVVAEAMRAKSPQGPWAHTVLDGLPRFCPKKVSRPLLEVAAAETSDHDALRNLSGTAARFQHPDLARELLERIPEADRRADDWMNLGRAFGLEGRNGDALAATAKGAAKDDGTLRPWCLNNAAWYGLRHQPEAPVEVRQAWLSNVIEARRLLLEKRPNGWQGLLHSIACTEAEVRRALGDVAGALRALTEAETGAELGGEGELIRARVLASSGDPVLGRRGAERALELLHPESVQAREARELLATFTPGN